MSAHLETSVDTLKKSSLTDLLVTALTKAIIGGEFKAGDKLPTGPALAQRFGVSLTVVREALSSLKNEGLVEIRHGSGVFAAATARARPFRIESVGSSQPAVGASQIFELRSGVEIRAAELAAQRRSKSQLHAIVDAHETMKREVGSGRDGVEADMIFHQRIAEAAGNPLFVSFLDFLGQSIRETIAFSRTSDAWALQQAEVMQEHENLVNAIRLKDVNAAGEAANTHMKNCLLRCH